MNSDLYRRLSRDAMSVHDVARALGIAPTYVRELAKETDLPTARKVGRDIIYWPPDVEALANTRRKKQTRIRN